MLFIINYTIAVHHLLWLGGYAPLLYFRRLLLFTNHYVSMSVTIFSLLKIIRRLLVSVYLCIQDKEVMSEWKQPLADVLQKRCS